MVGSPVEVSRIMVATRNRHERSTRIHVDLARGRPFHPGEGDLGMTAVPHEFSIGLLERDAAALVV
jgi:hypothetical protein